MPIYKDIVLRFGGDSKDLERSLSSTKKSISRISAATAGLGRSLTTGVTVPLSALAAAATNTAVEYESAFAGVKKTVDATDGELQQLYESTVKLSETIPVSSTTLMNIEELGGQLGISTDNLLGFTEVIAGIGEATNLTVEEAATQFAQFANITGMNQSDFDRLGSTLVDLGNNAATTEADIMNMSMRIAGAGKSAGMQVTDILALATTLSSLGIEAEAGGTAISTIIAEIDKQVATSGEDLETWAATAGMSAEEFAAAWRADPVVALQAVIEGMADMQGEGGNLSVLLEQLGIGSIRQSDAFKRMANSGDLFNATLETARSAWEDNSALATETGRRYETTASKVQIFMNKLSNVAATLGGPLAEALADALDDLSPLIKAAADAAQAFADMDRDTQLAIMTIGGIAAAAGPVLVFVSKVTGPIGDFVGKLQEAAAGFDAIPVAAGKADGKVTMNAATKAVDGVETAAKDAGAAVEGIGAAAATADAATSMAGAKADLDDTATKAKGAAKAIDGNADSLTAAAKQADGISMAKATDALDDVGESATSAAKAISGGADSIDAAASTADAAVTMTTAKTSLGDVETKATKAAKAIDGADGITAAVASADSKTLGKVTGELGNVETAATKAAMRIGGGAAGPVLAVALAGLAAAGIIVGLVTLYNHFKEIQEQAKRVEEATGGITAALERLNETGESTDVEDSFSQIVEDSKSIAGSIKSAADDTISLYDSLAADNFKMEASISRVSSLGESIQELAGKETLTSEEQRRLNVAVSEFERLTGESISTVDDETGAIIVNADAVGSLVDAYARKARMAGYESALTKVYEAQGDAMLQVAEATEQLGKSQAAVDSNLRQLGMTEQQVMDARRTAAVDMNEESAALVETTAQLIEARDLDKQSLETATAVYDGATATADLYAETLYNVSAEEEQATEATEATADAVETTAEATEEATEQLKEFTTAGGATVEVSEEMADALGDAEERFTSAAKAVGGMGDGVTKAIGDAGYSVTQFALMVEEAGGGLDHFAAVYDSMGGAADPFAQMEVSASGAANAVRDADGNITNLAQSTQQLYENIEHNQSVVDQFNEAITALYEQAQTEADIAFVDQLVEKGPAALGELQNIASANGDAAITLHDLADAQERLDQSVASTAVNAELQRMAASYRLFGTEALGSAYAVDQATGNITTIVGEGADAMVVTIDQATGEIIGAISASAPEAQAAAAELRESATTGVDGTAEDFGAEGEAAGAAFADGASSQSGEVAASSTFLGEEAYNALVTLPDEMQARGQVAGSSLGYGLWVARTQAANYATQLIAKVIEALGGAGSDAENKGRGLGNRFRAGISATSTNVEATAKTLASTAATGLGNQAAVAETKGTTLGSKFVSGIKSKSTDAKSAGTTLATNAVIGMAAQYTNATTNGSNTGEKFYAGVLSQSSNAGSSGRAVAEAARNGMASFTSQAYRDGAEMVSNYANGIRSRTSEAYQAAYAVANSVKSLLHFTEPDEGPLVGINDSGAEMVRNYAAGMRAEVATVQEAARQVAAAAKFDGMVQPSAEQLSVGEPIYNAWNIETLNVRKESDIQAIADELHRMQVQDSRGRLRWQVA